jgi:hypothetical protein
VRGVAVLVALAACGGGASGPALEEPPIPQAPAGTDREAMKRETAVVEDIASRACACKGVACWEGIDRDFSKYVREDMTLNDPVTDLETWPADLDARARRAFMRIADCKSAQGQSPVVFGVVAVRVVSDFKNAACACPNADCARSVQENYEEASAEIGDVLADGAAMTEMRADHERLVACVEKHLGSPGQQAVLDLKVLRRDACECRDVACADEVQARFDQFLVVHEHTNGNPAEVEQIRTLASEMAECLRAARGESP